jgi:nucleotide-binding universal stress UspA family protein
MCVLNVIDLFGFPAGFGGVGPITDAETKAGEELVAAAARRLARRGLEVVTALTEGYPPSSISEYASQWGADFIVVGSHGHSGISRFLLGSVAQGVLRNAPCSVEIVKRLSGGGPMMILLATDGSEYSNAAAKSVASRQWPQGTKVKVVSAIKVIIPATDPWYAAGETIARLLEENKKHAEEDIEVAKKIVSDAGLEVTEAVLTESAKASIVDEAKDWGADLVVVGSHGRRGLNRFLMGSVSEAVAMHVHCSVDVIRDRTLAENKA